MSPLRVFFFSNTIRHRLHWTADNWEKRLLRKHSCSFSFYCWLNVICGDATHACLISVLWPYFMLVLFPLPALTRLSMLFVNECLFTSVICICMPGTVVVPVGGGFLYRVSKTRRTRTDPLGGLETNILWQRLPHHSPFSPHHHHHESASPDAHLHWHNIAWQDRILSRCPSIADQGSELVEHKRLWRLGTGKEIWHGSSCILISLTTYPSFPFF